MDFASNIGSILLWTLWFFLFFAVIMVLFRVLGDLLSDASVGGGAKFGWCVFIIFLPFLGLLVYLAVRGKGMAERQSAKLADMQAAQDAYIREAAGTAASPAQEIASAKALLDSGAITADEFNSLKSKALAG